MRKTLVLLSIALAFTATSAVADQATLEALQYAGVTMTTEEAEAVFAAQNEQIPEVIAALIAAHPEQAAAIIAAVKNLSTSTNAANITSSGLIILPTSSIPTSGGGGGSSRIASPN